MAGTQVRELPAIPCRSRSVGPRPARRYPMRCPWSETYSVGNGCIGIGGLHRAHVVRRRASPRPSRSRAA